MSVDCMHADVLIRDQEAALAAIKAMDPNKGSGGSWEKGAELERWFSWVPTADIQNTSSLPQALTVWGYDSFAYKYGVSVLGMDRGKWGDDEQLWRALAPFVDDGGELQFSGNGEMWRYLFKGGELVRQQGDIVWQ